MKRIFISHASLDKELVELFVDDILVKGLEIGHKDIFCTSIEGLGIKSGTDFVNSLKEHLDKCEVAILVLTESYKASEVCLNEMGAVWVTSKKIFPFIAGSLTFNNVGVVQRNNQIAKIDSKSDIDSFRDEIKKSLSIEEIPTARWNSSVDKFLKKSKEIKVPSASKIERSEYDKILKEKNEIQNEYNDLDEENENLRQQIKELESLKDSNGVKKIKKKYSDPKSLDEFENVIRKTNRLFKTINNTVVARTILAEFAGVKPDVQYGPFDGFSEKIDDAIRRKFLNNDDFICTEKPPIPEINQLLNKLCELDETSEFVEAYEEKHGQDYDPKDQDFWDKHFDY